MPGLTHPLERAVLKRSDTGRYTIRRPETLAARAVLPFMIGVASQPL